MRFAAVHRAYMLQPPALGASCSALGAWLRLLVFASDRDSECVPVFANERESMTASGVTLAEIEEAVVAGLVKREGDRMVVGGFDHAGLAAYRARAAGGQKGAQFGAVGPTGKRGGRPKKSPLEPLKGFSGNPSRTPQATPYEPPSSLLSLPSPSDPDDPDSSEPRVARSEPALLSFPCVGNGATEFLLTQRMVDEWSPAYPALDVLAEVKRALAWVKASPKNRKTANGMSKFLVAWLGRAQDRGSHASARMPAREPRYGHSRAEEGHHTNGEVKL